MKLPFLSRTRSPVRPSETASPQQLFAEAVADRDYSKKTCLRSLSTRTVFLTGENAGVHQAGRLDVGVPTDVKTTVAERVKTWIAHRLRRSDEPVRAANNASPQYARRPADDAPSHAIATITRAEPGLWGGRKAHFIRLHVEFHPDSKHYLQRAEVHIRLWRAGDAIKSFAQHSHLNLLAIDQPDAHELGDDAPPIVLYAPRAVIGRPAASTTEPYWNGYFKPGDHFVFFGEALPPRNLASAGPQDSNQPRSLLNIAAFGDSKERQPAPHFDVGLVVLSDGKPFEMTASTLSLHWGLPAVHSYLFTPYKPAKFTYDTRLIPRKEKKIAVDFQSDGMREKLKGMVPWAKEYDTIWFGGPSGCVDKPSSHGRNCSSHLCATCKDSRKICKDRRRAERAASLQAGIMTSNPE